MTELFSPPQRQHYTKLRLMYETTIAIYGEGKMLTTAFVQLVEFHYSHESVQLQLFTSRDITTADVFFKRFG